MSERDVVGEWEGEGDGDERRGSKCGSVAEVAARFGQHHLTPLEQQVLPLTPALSPTLPPHLTQGPTK